MVKIVDEEVIEELNLSNIECLLGQILVEARITNFHLSNITDNEITQGDIS